jgi:hypothetical protein
LQKSKNEDGWDLIEVKGSTSGKPSHLNDLSFQLSVFTEAGYKINSCILMLLNKEYIFNNTLDIEKLFKLEDVTSDVFELQSSTKSINKVWDELFPPEQARIINLLVRDITINPDGMNINIYKQGLNSLNNEING